MRFLVEVEAEGAELHDIEESLQGVGRWAGVGPLKVLELLLTPEIHVPGEWTSTYRSRGRTLKVSSASVVPTAAPVPRLLSCESEAALYNLLTSLNDAGNHAEIACLSDLNGAPFLATLWDVDYASKVHYVFTEGDSGQMHCHNCAECEGKNGRLDCDYDSPGFPVVVVLTEDPEPSDTLDEEAAAWWRSSR